MAIRTDWEDPGIEYAARALLGAASTPSATVPPLREELQAMLEIVRQLGQGEVALYFTEGAPRVSVIRRPRKERPRSYLASCIVTHSHLDLLRDWMSWSLHDTEDQGTLELLAASLSLKTMSPFLAQQGNYDEATHMFLLSKLILSPELVAKKTTEDYLGKVVGILFPVAHELGHHTLDECLPVPVRGQLRSFVREVVRTVDVGLENPDDRARVKKQLESRQGELLEEAAADYLALYLIQNVLKSRDREGRVDMVNLILHTVLGMHSIAQLENQRATVRRISLFGWKHEMVFKPDDTLYMEVQMRARIMVEMAKLHANAIGAPHAGLQLEFAYNFAAHRFPMAYRGSSGAIDLLTTSDPSMPRVAPGTTHQDWLQSLQPYLTSSEGAAHAAQLLNWSVLDEPSTRSLSRLLRND